MDDICRYCQRPIAFNGMFWSDKNRQINCPASGGQHEPGGEEDESA